MTLEDELYSQYTPSEDHGRRQREGRESSNEEHLVTHIKHYLLVIRTREISSKHCRSHTNVSREGKSTIKPSLFHYRLGANPIHPLRLQSWNVYPRRYASVWVSLMKRKNILRTIKIRSHGIHETQVTDSEISEIIQVYGSLHLLFKNQIMKEKLTKNSLPPCQSQIA